MPATPSDVVLEVLDRVCRLSAGDRSQVDRLAGLYAETTDVRHPMAPLGDEPLVDRRAVREHFAASVGAGVDRMEATDVRIHTTADPEVVVEEFVYLVHAGERVTRVPCVFVVRVREGRIVESRDYAHHLGFAVATGTTERLLTALAG